jgi:hypothetical protein
VVGGPNIIVAAGTHPGNPTDRQHTLSAASAQIAACLSGGTGRCARLREGGWLHCGPRLDEAGTMRSPCRIDRRETRCLEWLWLLLPIVLIVLLIVGERRRRCGSGPTIKVEKDSWHSGSGGASS